MEFDADKKESTSACDRTMNRKQFLEMVLRRAAVAGAIVAAPKIVDKFLVPPVQAMAYTGCRDTVPVASDTTGTNKCDAG